MSRDDSLLLIYVEACHEDSNTLSSEEDVHSISWIAMTLGREHRFSTFLA